MGELASGSCLCGAVRYRIQGAFEHFFLCHCSRCRKDSGSAHSANLFCTHAEIEWLSGKVDIKVFQLPDTLHVKSFCKECGSALPALQMDSKLLVVPAGSLDSQIDIKPTARICYASRAEWVDGITSVETINGLPG